MRKKRIKRININLIKDEKIRKRFEEKVIELVYVGLKICGDMLRIRF